MKIVLQRVTSAAVVIGGETVASIQRGLLLLVGFGRDDSEGVLQPMARKLLNLRVFSDGAGRLSRSLIDIEGDLLLVPQFTLYADTRKGRRPDFTAAMSPDEAVLMFDRFTAVVRSTADVRVETGRFGADMQVSLVNDGPVTILLQN